MWNGKKKAVTFSFDDGVTQDIRLIEILNKYGLKGTFNINSGLLGLPNFLNRDWGKVNHTKILASEVKALYEGHEVAVHSLTHPTLVGLDEETIIRQVEEDRKALEKLCGYPIVGMAYPNGTNDDRVAAIIANNSPIKYSRTITSTHSFTVQKENLLRYNPTVYYVEDCLEELVDRFLASESDEDQLLYIWGHSYEMDARLISWEKFEEICKKLAFRDDIFYGTNKEVLL
ncbi:MAG: polysaccharide deacetylase family protein [Clostridia bacterium]|nr:polysaccharide deacetylase family protein [Clostridia bacterium]